MDWKRLTIEDLVEFQGTLEQYIFAREQTQARVELEQVQQEKARQERTLLALEHEMENKETRVKELKERVLSDSVSNNNGDASIQEAEAETVAQADDQVDQKQPGDEFIPKKRNEAGKILGVSPATLSRWVNISPDSFSAASRKRGGKFYEEDMEVLRKIKQLSDEGLDYRAIKEKLGEVG